MLEFSLIKLQALRTLALLKTDSNTGSFLRNLSNFYEDLLTEHLRMTASCVYLRILRSFSEHLIYRAPLGNCLFHVQVAEFQPPDTVKNYFAGAFQASYSRMAVSHSKTFKSSKILKIPENYL